ncbi:MAG: tyrosine-type recombinase/integrase [Clostridiales bacterium]|jgi:integrase|nr:tyrosine-type recombinase/integrase [Clostridiales bacterium]
MREYTSKIAPLMQEFEQYRLAPGRWSENCNLHLSLFDGHCASSCADVEVPAQEMLDAWRSQRETEANNSCRFRICAVVSFVRYLRKRGMTDVRIPIIPRKEARTYIPHAFSEMELCSFFDACDSIANYSKTEGQISRRLAVPVFFRLLHSSGIRANEARMLRQNDVSLVNGVLNIEHSKGRGRHFIAVRESMLKLMRDCDRAIAKMHPNRLHFFPARDGKRRTKQWAPVNFKKMWGKNNSSRAVPYEFRHNYAIENINRWTDDGFGFHQKLRTLGKSMGRSAVESAKYCYSLVPRLADVLAEHANEDEAIPEACYESC